MNNKSRVLISTVGAWTDSVDSNTMSELFSEYNKDKLACPYIKTDISDLPSPPTLFSYL